MLFRIISKTNSTLNTFIAFLFEPIRTFLSSTKWYKNLKNGAPRLSIVNISNETKTLKISSLVAKPLHNYEIYTFNDTNINDQRTDKLLKILKPNLSKWYTTVQHIKNKFRLPQNDKVEIKILVQKFLDNDLIWPSCFNYNSPLVLVPKKGAKDGKKWHLCIHYKIVNKKLVADKYLLPRIDDILDGLGRAKFFRMLDLFNGKPVSEILRTEQLTNWQYYQY